MRTIKNKGPALCGWCVTKPAQIAPCQRCGAKPRVRALSAAAELITVRRDTVVLRSH